MLTVLRCAQWDRSAAGEHARELAATALENAAKALRVRDDDRVRALIERALRRIALVSDLE